MLNPCFFTGHPCKNGGVCRRQGTSDYACACEIGFMGTHCEEGYHACATHPHPCLNGGECYFLPSSIHTALCHCLQGKISTAGDKDAYCAFTHC